IKNYDELPKEAKQYLARLAELCRAPISLISTGAEREATIFCDHPI
ncbi:MAG: adenylosuccinate synthase, partial [Haemophilus parainfluenzae]